MGTKYRTRKEILTNKLLDILAYGDTHSITQIVEIVDEYEQNNLDTIDKLKRDKKITTTAINGGLRQTINAHGPITKELIGSASKRIYGSLLSSEKKLEKISIKIILISIFVGVIIGASIVLLT